MKPTKPEPKLVIMRFKEFEKVTKHLKGELSDDELMESAEASENAYERALHSSNDIVVIVHCPLCGSSQAVRQDEWNFQSTKGHGHTCGSGRCPSHTYMVLDEEYKNEKTNDEFTEVMNEQVRLATLMIVSVLDELGTRLTFCDGQGTSIFGGKPLISLTAIPVVSSSNRPGASHISTPGTVPT